MYTVLNVTLNTAHCPSFGEKVFVQLYVLFCVETCLEYFASSPQQPSYRLAIRTEGMVEDLVKNLKTNTPELQMHCASAIFKVR